MARIGITYKIVGYYNPLGKIFPARVYPIYKPASGASKDGVFYLQVCDEEGIVQDFQEIDQKIDNLYGIRNEQRKFIGVGQEQIYGFATSEGEAIFFKSYVEYLSYLRDLVKGRNRRWITSKPVSGVEISRILKDYNLEDVFSSLAVVKLSRISLDAAKGWLNSAPISEKARTRGNRSLLKFENLRSRKEEEKDTICTIALSKHTYFQGDLINLFDDGKVKIKIGRKFYVGWPVWNMKKLPLIDLVEERKGNFIFKKQKESAAVSEVNEKILRILNDFIIVP